MATQTLKETVMHDHRELFYDQYKNAADAESKEKWSNQYTWVVTRHSVSEEIVVYPLFEKKLGEEGKKMADKDRTEHREVKVLLARVGNLSVGAPEHENVLSKVNDVLAEHMKGEEEHDLPLLESKLQTEESYNAEREFQRTKALAPTRPHPTAPDKPPYEILAGFLALPMDKIKDLFSKFPTEEEIKAAKGKAGI
ncbi:hypothetical protein F5J12DRAFT_715014 [Pisolithus orientalis]|uniref:uncharacterized protein n=1 Tax=Pisolithus orientalis TaxID=936130 RepID=UPI002224EA2F|nr:uncharacterized protein F5J12DRAFT_715014 [Pisolithus orientalis]KAI6028899.1 hypothetical protein F5J12DRAFT_715014 [Pisolithus orientalis]